MNFTEKSRLASVNGDMITVLILEKEMSRDWFCADLFRHQIPGGELQIKGARENKSRGCPKFGYKRNKLSRKKNEKIGKNFHEW